MIKPMAGIPFLKDTELYKRSAKYLPVVSFVGGFLWDSLTLTRIDRLSDNLILLGYLIMLGASITLVNLVEHQKWTNRHIIKFQKWYPLAIQFFLGGLISSYVVFYFKSAAITKNWLFLGILIILLFANEFMEKRLTNIYLQFTLYFLVSYSFFIFFIPVLIKIMNRFVFIFSGILSLALMGGYFRIFYKKWQILQKKQVSKLSGLILSMFIFIQIAYFLNWIPPVPLALKFAGIYHQVEKTGDNFHLKLEDPPWYHFWKRSDDPFHHAAGDTVFCFVAIFAPIELEKRIYHIWQIKDPSENRWSTTDKLSYEVIGGREGGYRGYTYKRHIAPGQWRVEVSTDDGLILGRISFEIISSNESPQKFKSLWY